MSYSTVNQLQNHSVSTIPQRGPAAANSAAPSAISAINGIYSSSDKNFISSCFNDAFSMIKSDPALFSRALSEMYSRNDSFDLTSADGRTQLPEKDKMKVAIRNICACIARLAELPDSGNRLATIYHNISSLYSPGNWQIAAYFDRAAFNAMAKSDPRLLKEMINKNQASDKQLATLALLRGGVKLSQNEIKSAISSSGSFGSLALLQYVEDPALRLQHLRGGLQALQGKPFLEKCYREREIINTLASFPEGRAELDNLQAQGKISFVVVNGIYFGSLAGSGISAPSLAGHQRTFQEAAVYINRANQQFGGREAIHFVDITPDAIGGQQLNPAGWGENALYLTVGMLNESPRAVSFILLHEACEQKYEKGVFSSRLAKTYLTAVKEGKANGGLLEIFKLGNRIGGSYTNTGFGHPWDSEREWLAETVSSVIIGEPLPNKASPAQNAARQLLQEKD